MKDKRAVLIFEGAWELYETDINRSSVLPFFEGMARCHPDVEIIHTRFYDKRGFASAFQALCQGAFANAIVYVTAHGNGRTIGKADIFNVMLECNLASRVSNITGVVLGSCFAAGNGIRSTEHKILPLIEGSRIAWVSGYSCASNWLEGTLIDLCLIQQMLLAEEADFATFEHIAQQLAEALAGFSPTSRIGLCRKERPVPLGEGLAFFAQARGQGRRARQITDEVWAAWADTQLAGAHTAS